MNTTPSGWVQVGSPEVRVISLQVWRAKWYPELEPHHMTGLTNPNASED